MIAIGGWGGVKFELVTAGISVVFDSKRAYCGQPVKSPEGWSKRTANGRDIGQIDGWRVKLDLFVENVSATDYLLWEDLIQIINLHVSTKEAIRIYPKWNSDSSSSIWYDCKLASDWHPQDVSKKWNVGQRVSLKFESVELLTALPIHEDTLPEFVLGTSDGQILVANSGE